MTMLTAIVEQELDDQAHRVAKVLQLLDVEERPRYLAWFLASIAEQIERPQPATKARA